MTKISLTDLVNLQNETTAVNAINSNNAVLKTASDNTLSRDGTSPNQMNAPLDMNSNHILNLPTPTTLSDPIRLSDVHLLNGSGTINISALPAGGTAGQLLAKNTSTNFDASWKNVSAGLVAGSGISITGTTPATISLNSTAVLPVGGTTGQVLSKTSATNYDVSWRDEGGSTPNFNVKVYGATGDGATDDTISIQAAIAACIAAGGGTIFFPSPSSFYKTTSPLLIDLSAIGTRFQSRIHILGDSPGKSLIKNVVSGKIIDYTGSASNVEAYLGIQSIRLLGNGVVGSIGLSLKKAAFVYIADLVIEGMDLGADLTDVDQIGIYDSEFRFNNGGIRGNASAGVTDPNSWTFVNTAVSNNATYGLQVSNANSWSWVGGSIQYNGTIAGGATNYGITLTDTGSGYGNVLFSGMAFEGNGGAGDFISQQTGAGAQHCNVTFDTCSFIRTGTFVGVGYGTNQINVNGTGAKANYKIINSNFYGFSPYAASAGRPAIANTNANSKIEIDGLTTFWSNTEAPTTSSLYTGAPGSRTGSITFSGVTSGSTVVQASAAASGTLTLPNATDTLMGKNTSDTLTNKTFDTASNLFKIAGTTVSGTIGSGANVALSTNPIFPDKVYATNGFVGGTAANSGVALASTSSGAPSGDFVTILGSTIGLTGVTTITGNTAVVGTLGSTKTISSTSAPATAPHFDTSGMAGISVAGSGGSQQIVPSGANYCLLFVAETVISGTGALFLLTGGSTTLIATDAAAAWISSAAPGAGKLSVGFSGGVYKVFNNFSASTATVKATLIRAG